MGLGGETSFILSNTAFVLIVEVVKNTDHAILDDTTLVASVFKKMDQRVISVAILIAISTYACGTPFKDCGNAAE